MTEIQWRELEEPEKVDEMTGPELSALRAANALIAAQSERVALESRLLEAAAWRKNALMSDIASRHELEVNSTHYTLDDETGAIFRTAVADPSDAALRRAQWHPRPDELNHHEP